MRKMSVEHHCVAHTTQSLAHVVRVPAGLEYAVYVNSVQSCTVVLAPPYRSGKPGVMG